MTAEQRKSILDYALVNGILDAEACETIARRAGEGVSTW